VSRPPPPVPSQPPVKRLPPHAPAGPMTRSIPHAPAGPAPSPRRGIPY
jgi:hypothetical protein